MILTGISINQTPLDWDGNTKRIIESLNYYIETEIYKQYDEHILLFPELALSGYGCEDGFLFSDTKKKSFEKLLDIIKFSNKISKALILLGTPFYYRGSIFNCISVIHSGKLLAMIPKSFLAGEGIHYEQRWFTFYDKKFTKIEHKFNNQIYEFLFGKGIVEFNSIRIGIEICEDAWVNKRPALKYYYDQDLDLLLNPAASHFGFGKFKRRKNIAVSSSYNFYCYYFSVNLLGNEAGKAIYDGSFLFSKCGNLLYAEQTFSFFDILIRSFLLDFSDLKNKRDRIYSRRKDRKLKFEETILKIESKKEIKKPVFDFQSNQNLIQSEYSNFIHYQFIESYSEIKDKDSNQNEFKEFLEVERLGLFDYLRKTKSSGYTISLSGGADSSICAILVYQMIRKGIKELGLNSFIKKLNFSLSEEEKKALSLFTIEKQIEYFSKRMIHTLYQQTKQNTERTKTIAEELAKEIHSNHHTIDIQNLLEENIRLMENITNQKLNWNTHNIPLQNIQARIRSPIIWFLANLTNSVLISTSNRSEGSVGYATMDGDTSGGLAPIAGIDKPFLLKFLNFISEYQDEFTKPILSAKKILQQPPSAELLPIEINQTDEKDLMPYPILSMIERMAIEELLSPNEILNKFINIKNKKNINYNLPFFNDFIEILNRLSEKDLKEMINKFFDLWHKNQWKRERFATSFHIDSYNIDPRGWFRFPVLSKKIQIDD